MRIFLIFLTAILASSSTLQSEPATTQSLTGQIYDRGLSLGNSLSNAFHSQLQALDQCYNNVKAKYKQCILQFYGKMKAEITRRKISDVPGSLDGFLKKMREYTFKGRKIANEKKDDERQDERKQVL